VTRAVGTEPTVAIDLHEDVTAPKDIYLLCLDGLSDMVDDRDICRLMKTFGADLDKAAEQLIALANENGGKDNVSVILVKPNKAFPAERHGHNKFVS
jgi:PPM family protein phosphatase